MVQSNNLYKCTKHFVPSSTVLYGTKVPICSNNQNMLKEKLSLCTNKQITMF